MSDRPHGRTAAGHPSGPVGGEELRVTLGQFGGPFGVRGWVKVTSYTEPLDEILDFPDWQVKLHDGEWRVLRPAEGRLHGKGLVARLEGVTDRDEAARLSRCDISVPRSALPTLADGQHYWADLEGLEVVTTEGVALGRLDHFVETPANPVMVVLGAREHWIPLVAPHLRSVELDAGRVVVDWDPDF